jgi:hypothetical protein
MYRITPLICFVLFLSVNTVFAQSVEQAKKVLASISNNEQFDSLKIVHPSWSFDKRKLLEVKEGHRKFFSDPIGTVDTIKYHPKGSIYVIKSMVRDSAVHVLMDYIYLDSRKISMDSIQKITNLIYKEYAQDLDFEKVKSKYSAQPEVKMNWTPFFYLQKDIWKELKPKRKEDLAIIHIEEKGQYFIAVKLEEDKNANYLELISITIRD